MGRSPLPTREQIEALTAYLPRLYAEGFTPVLRWEGGGKGSDGTYSLAYPTYHPTVEEFFRAVSGGGWLDHGYNPEQAYQTLKDEALVQGASLDQIKTMLTFCVRGERFSDGHWAEMIEKGYIRRLLERLNAIAKEMR
jgi:hypothetical protein